MEVLPHGTMFDDDISFYATKLKIPYFIGVKMRDELISPPQNRECGVLNLNTHLQKGSHWTCWYKLGMNRYYFDSFGEPPPRELLYYLKTADELNNDLPAIKCNAVTVQHDQSNECGSLCLFTLKQLSNGIPFSEIIQNLEKRYFENKPLKLKI